MIRMHKDTFVPKYTLGSWQWNVEDEKFSFVPTYELAHEVEHFITCGGFKYRKNLNQIEEMIFRQEFARSDLSHDSDLILIQDIKNLVLFLAPTEIVNKVFISFVHMRIVDRFLNCLIIYFEYFLKVVEFTLIRRDEASGPTPQIQSENSTDMKLIFSNHLIQYRLLLAREYAEIILGNGEAKKYYFMVPLVNIAKTRTDRAFHEAFLSFATQVVWIAMHRRALDVIEMEMDRLFRSEHFKLQPVCPIQFSVAEASLLYGINNKRLNFRVQNSPLILELKWVARVNVPLLWIGKRKYRGTDLRIHQLELEYIVPPSQLSLIDLTHGILGHPKKIYNTLLTLDWQAVRAEQFSETYDPYHIIRQPALNIPNLDEEKIRASAIKYDSLFVLRHNKEEVSSDAIRKWINRDQVVTKFKGEGMIISTFDKCNHELNNKQYGPRPEVIVNKFLAKTAKKRKRLKLQSNRASK